MTDFVPCPCGCGAEFVDIVAERESGVRADASAARRAPTLSAAHRPMVFLLTGMPGAGKSTVGRQLAERFDRGAHIDIDMVFHHFTVAGKAEPAATGSESTAQGTLAVLNASAMARNYVDAGFVCVIERAVARRADVERCAEAVRPHAFRLVVLAPPLEVSEARDAARSGKHVAEHFRHLYGDLHRELSGVGLWLDTTCLEPAETVSLILDQSERAMSPTPNERSEGRARTAVPPPRSAHLRGQSVRSRLRQLAEYVRPSDGLDRMDHDVAVPGHPAPRAAGKRIPYAEVAASVRDWIAGRFGAHEVVREHIGGMSPGCATTLRLASGEKVFVKAVGSDLNEQTVTLFRTEQTTLSALPPAPYRPTLVDTFDDGDWVAIVTEAFDGRLPRLGDDGDFDAVAAVIETQAVELTPPPAEIAVTTLSETARRWATRWAGIAEEPQRFLPTWAVALLDELLLRVERLPGRLQEETLCHFDVRDDNLLIDEAGNVAIIDWGMARLGPQWIDLAMLAWQRPAAADAEQRLRRFVPDADQDILTDLLVAFGGSQAWNAHQPPRPNLPTLADFCHDDAQRLLALAAARLAVT